MRCRRQAETDSLERAVFGVSVRQGLLASCSLCLRWLRDGGATSGETHGRKAPQTSAFAPTPAAGITRKQVAVNVHLPAPPPQTLKPCSVASITKLSCIRLLDRSRTWPFSDLCTFHFGSSLNLANSWMGVIPQTTLYN